MAASTAAPHIPPTWRDKIRHGLWSRGPLALRATIDILDELLQKTGAVVAGGFPLACIFDEPNTPERDVDIYCSTPRIPDLLLGLFNLADTNRASITKIETVDASHYSNSFLKLNEIKCIYRLYFTNLRTFRTVDVISVRKKRPVLEVCRHSDFTFCQVWYDGATVGATHPMHILSKHGYLQKEYIPYLLRGGNALLEGRIRKYIARGFTIDYDPTYTCTLFPLPALAQKCDPPHVEIPHRFQRDVLRWLSQYIYEQPDFTMISDHWRTPCFEPGLHLQGGKQLEATGIGYLYIHGNPDEQFIADGYDSEEMTDEETRKVRDTNRRACMTYTGTRPDEYGNELLLDTPQRAAAAKRLADAEAAKDNDPMDEDLQDAYRDAIQAYKDQQKTAVDAAVGELNELWYWRMLNKMFYFYTIDRNVVNNYASATDPDALAYVQYLNEHCRRKGNADYMFGGEGEPVYDLHLHPLKAAISRETMEAYLEGHIQDIHKDSVPCYYRPNPRTTIGNCRQKLSLKDVEMIVSPEFYTRYTAPVVLDVSLSQTIPFYDVLLSNTPSHGLNNDGQPDAFGVMYHTTICPFCLQLERREHGCLYVIHANPEGRPDFQAPFCISQYLVPEVFGMYQAFADERIPAREAQHFEFCAECGTACLNHQHFDLYHPGHLLPELFKDGVREHDYSRCPYSFERLPEPAGGWLHDVEGDFIVEYKKDDSGKYIAGNGGRRILIMRALVIRDTYANPAYKRIHDERRIAAETADSVINWNYAGNPDLPADELEKVRSYATRADAILAAEPDARKWNADLAMTKVYTDRGAAAADAMPSPIVGRRLAFDDVVEEKQNDPPLPAAWGEAEFEETNNWTNYGDNDIYNDEMQGGRRGRRGRSLRRHTLRRRRRTHAVGKSRRTEKR